MIPKGPNWSEMNPNNPKKCPMLFKGSKIYQMSIMARICDVVCLNHYFPHFIVAIAGSQSSNALPLVYGYTSAIVVPKGLVIYCNFTRTMSSFGQDAL